MIVEGKLEDGRQVTRTHAGVTIETHEQMAERIKDARRAKLAIHSEAMHALLVEVRDKLAGGLGRPEHRLQVAEKCVVSLNRLLGEIG